MDLFLKDIRSDIEITDLFLKHVFSDIEITDILFKDIVDIGSGRSCIEQCFLCFPFGCCFLGFAMPIFGKPAHNRRIAI